MTIPSWLQSSQDPQKVSLAVKGFLLGIIPFAIIFSEVFGLRIAREELESIADTVESSIVAVWGAISLLLTLWGLIRKLAKKP